MADKSPLQNLCDETTCSICLEHFDDPVIIDCGHIFCQACITQYLETLEKDACCCPQCREPCQQRNFKPNRQLASIVEIAKKFSLQIGEGAEVLGQVCERHQEPLKLFCEDDQAPICVVCDKAKEHRGHKVIPKEDAFAEYKSKICNRVEWLKKERNRLLFFKQNREAEREKLLEETETHREKIVADFKQLYQFLNEQELLLLSKLKDLEKEIRDSGNEKIANLSEEISSVDKLIEEMQEKHNQPEKEFFQDIKSTLERCTRNKHTGLQYFLPLVKERLESLFKMFTFLETAMKEFKDTVLAGLQERKAKDMTIPTLVLSTEDPSAACLQVAPSTTGLQMSRQAPETVKEKPIQLCCWSSVMGVEKITSGSHSWVVDAGTEKVWAVGVAKESLRHDSPSSCNHGLWAIGVSPNGTYNAFSSSKMSLKPYPLSFEDVLVTPLGKLDIFWRNFPTRKRIRVFLNYEDESLTFVDCQDNTIIHAFLNISFAGEEISSWFSVGKMG